MAKSGKSKSGDGSAKGGGGGVVGLVLLTLIGASLGIGYKLYILDAPTAPPATVDASKKEPGNQDKDHGAGEAQDGKGADQETSGEGAELAVGNSVVQLPPIVTDMRGEPKRWMRLQASLVFSVKPEEGYDLVAEQTSADLLGYLRTVTLAQIEGPEGLEYLTDDLEELAKLRSKGAITRLLINSLVTE